MDALDGYLSRRLTEAADRESARLESRLPAIRTDALTRIKKRRGQFRRVATVTVAAIALGVAIAVPRLLRGSNARGLGVVGVGEPRITNFDIPGRIVFGNGQLWVDNADIYDPTKNLEGFTSIDPATNVTKDGPPVTRGASGLAFVNGDIWVSGATSSGAGPPYEGFVERIDARTMTLLTRKHLGGLPYGITFDPPNSHDTGQNSVGSRGSIWLANFNGPGIWRLDLASGILASVDVGGPTWDVTSAEGLVWFLGKSGGLISVDPVTNDAEHHDVGKCPSKEISALGSLWVDGCDGYLRRVDPQSGTVTHEIDIGGDLEGIAELDGHLWVADLASDALVEIDPDGGRVLSRVPVGDQPLDVVSGAGALWIDHAQIDVVTRVDP